MDEDGDLALAWIHVAVLLTAAPETPALVRDQRLRRASARTGAVEMKGQL